MAIKATPFSSTMPVSPGSVLKDEIDFIGMTQKELADQMGRPAQAISEIVNGKKSVTPETALELEKVLGIEAHIWVNLEAGYRLTLARNREQAKIEAENEPGQKEELAAANRILRTDVARRCQMA
jgi:HTH-type transcriptional regulator/antitoxin HigA